MEHRLTDPVQQLTGVGERRAALYRKLGVKTIYDLLTLYPRTYLDLSHPLPILETVLGETNVIRATVYRKQGEQRIRKGLSLYKVFVTDGLSNLTVTIFNSKYMFDSLEENQDYLFYGKVTGTLLRREMHSPLCFPGQEEALIRPVYPLTEGLSNKLVQSHVREALKVWGDRLTDDLPLAIRREQSLCQLRYAVENIHFPTDAQALQIARKRLVFEELLILQLGLLLLRRRNRETTQIRLANRDITPFLQSLPFSLTQGQRQAIADSLQDMSRDQPMNRLVQGDVGSGKTMVAAALCYACHQNGYQAAVMAPTQILADQHYATFSRQLEPLGVKCCLLTGTRSGKKREALLNQIQEGEYSVIIGTHALVQQDVSFHSLGLVVTDEQHRFGVAQRATLAQKGENPHLLVMSATPIPRTLALMIYGDLDISAIRELPQGRQPIDTLVIDSPKRLRALGFIREHIRQGRQAYIVCPLIEENGSDLRSTQTYLQELQDTPLQDVRIGSLNGKMKPKEKEEVMSAFQRGELDVLVTTTVVEVGVDVPNANIMLIENAERFGLSQLHQLRGRVGRGQYKSWCILVSDHPGEDNRRRLKVMATVRDGFAIAEEDLKLRGPGDFFGERQHGLPELKIASLLDNMDLLNQTREIALQLLKEDPALSSPEHRGLKQMVRRLFSDGEPVAFN